MTDILYDPIEAIRDAFDTARHIVDIKNKLNLIEDENHQIFLALRRIERKVGLLVADFDTITQSLDNIDASVADINTDNAEAVALIADLKAQLEDGAGSLTAEQEDAIQARIQAAEAAIAAAASVDHTPEEPVA